MNPNLLIRRFLCGRPALFRSVHDLGFFSPGCPCWSVGSGSCSSVWLPAWLPPPSHAMPRLVVFKSVSNSLPLRPRPALLRSRSAGVQDHPAYIPRGQQLDAPRFHRLGLVLVVTGIRSVGSVTAPGPARTLPQPDSCQNLQWRTGSVIRVLFDRFWPERTILRRVGGGHPASTGMYRRAARSGGY